MKITLLALAVACLAAAAPASAPKTFSEGYWERVWGGGQYAVQYSLSIKVDDLDSATTKVNKILTDGGASPNGNSNYWNNNAQGRKSKMLAYTANAAVAEKLAKRLFAVGDLQNYQANRFGGQNVLKELDERIGLIAGEMESNKAALEKMPVASYFLNTQLSRLKASRESYAASANKAAINVSLIVDAPDQQNGR